jgi:hypothetical protein
MGTAESRSTPTSSPAPGPRDTRVSSTHRRPTQASRVLAALVEAGDYGVTCVDFVRLPTIDGGRPILNVRGRIFELRDSEEYGFRISSLEEWRNSCTVYVVHEDNRECARKLLESRQAPSDQQTPKERGSASSSSRVTLTPATAHAPATVKIHATGSITARPWPGDSGVASNSTGAGTLFDLSRVTPAQRSWSAVFGGDE